jgi:tRNA dimethylallyltransferase
MGPTAAGKTDIALELAAELPCEIISVDSALVYRDMDIGTGKPSRAVLERFPHHLVDILDPRDRYSAGQFVRDACRLISEITARGRVPLLVGGTMLYYRALLHGLAEMPSANAAFRKELEQRATQIGWPALHEELTKLDLQAAQRIGPNDAQRIQRALEVISLTGKPMSEVQRAAQPPLPDLKCLKLALNPLDRDQLYRRIEQRFMQMMASGFLAEVEKLFHRGDLNAELPAMRAVGYRQLWGHLAGEYSLEEAVRLGVLATRHLARRQLIWLRSEAELEWIDPSNAGASDQIKQRVTRFLQ